MFTDTDLPVLLAALTKTMAKAEIVFMDFFKGKPTGIQLFTQTVSHFLGHTENIFTNILITLYQSYVLNFLYMGEFD